MASEKIEILLPKPFLAALVAAFLVCCVFGGWISTQNPYANLPRFGRFMEPDSYFYPTLSSLCERVRKETLPGQVAVIVGGTSILNGACQTVDHLWTKRLQDKLGPGYHVFNLSFYGSPFSGVGRVVSEVMAREMPNRIIFFADDGLGSVTPPDGNSWYRYLHWDAQLRGLLEPWPERDRMVAFQEAHMNSKERDQIAELKRSLLINQWGHSFDLWTQFGYHVAFPVWTIQVAYSGHPMFGRRDAFPDVPVSVSKDPAPKRYEIYLKGTMEIVKTWVRGVVDSKDGKLTPIQSYADDYRNHVAAAIPPILRPCMVIVLTHINPYYKAQLSEDDHARIEEAYRNTGRLWESLGIRVIMLGDNFEMEDFFDMAHHTNQAADKMADLFADAVRHMPQKPTR